MNKSRFVIVLAAAPILILGSLYVITMFGEPQSQPFVDERESPVSQSDAAQAPPIELAPRDAANGLSDAVQPVVPPSDSALVSDATSNESAAPDANLQREISDGDTAEGD